MWPRFPLSSNRDDVGPFALFFLALQLFQSPASFTDAKHVVLGQPCAARWELCEPALKVLLQWKQPELPAALPSMDTTVDVFPLNESKDTNSQEQKYHEAAGNQAR